MVTFYFIRHGNAYDKRGLQTPESALNTEGIKQATILKKFTASKEFTTVLASPYKRAMETCQIATSNQNLDVKIVNDLREVGGDNWPNPLNYSFLSQQELGDLDEARSQVKKMWQELKNNYANSTKEDKILVFTHGNLIRILMSLILETDASRFQNFKIDFVSVSTVEIDDSGMETILNVGCPIYRLAETLCKM